jgi:hypothetical protein
MSNLRKHRVPLITAAGMIAIPLAFAFLSGAGAGTALGGLARLLGVFFTIFGGASIVMGVFLMAWVGWNIWRDGGSDVANG